MLLLIAMSHRAWQSLYMGNIPMQPLCALDKAAVMLSTLKCLLCYIGNGLQRKDSIACPLKVDPRDQWVLLYYYMVNSAVIDGVVM